MDPAALASVAGSALVGAMATDLWEQASSAIVAIWRKVRPDRAQVVEEDLAVLRQEVLAARQCGDRTAELELAADWRRQLGRLLNQHADIGEELQRVVDDVLRPALPEEERVRLFHQVNVAYDSARVFGVQGGNLIIHESPQASEQKPT
jgi:hypothetical protein